MRASELVSQLSALIDEHGDLEIFFDCESYLSEFGSVLWLDEDYLESPAFVIYSPLSLPDSMPSTVPRPDR